VLTVDVAETIKGPEPAGSGGPAARARVGRPARAAYRAAGGGSYAGDAAVPPPHRARRG
jgi:hypothetical protein